MGGREGARIEVAINIVFLESCGIVVDSCGIVGSQRLGTWFCEFYIWGFFGGFEGVSSALGTSEDKLKFGALLS